MRKEEELSTFPACCGDAGCILGSSLFCGGAAVCCASAVQFAAEHLAFSEERLQYFDPCLFPFSTERAHIGARIFCVLLALAGAFGGN